ncbi:MAG: type II toxin-antitoxin system VapC family toxin [Thermomicrobiales bacterium]
MSYLVDTDWVIDFLDGRLPAVQLMGGLFPRGVGISLITYMEAIEGVRGGSDPMGASRILHDFLDAVTIVGLSVESVERAADLRIALRHENRQINHRALDILIAVTAIERNLILVTRNIRDYNDLPGLQLYDLTG